MGIDQALFSKTRRRILGLLFGNPDRSHYMNEIVRHADSGIGAVQRELARMVKAGLVTVERHGNQKHFRANPACPVFDELRSIVRKAFDISEIIRASIAPVMRRIELAFIFGSAAQGDTDGELALLVVSETLGHAELETMLRHVSAESGRRIRLHLYKPDELKAARKGGDPFLKRVWRQPRVPLVDAG